MTNPTPTDLVLGGGMAQPETGSLVRSHLADLCKEQLAWLETQPNFSNKNVKRVLAQKARSHEPTETTVERGFVDWTHYALAQNWVSLDQFYGLTNKSRI